MAYVGLQSALEWELVTRKTNYVIRGLGFGAIPMAKQGREGEV